MKKRYVLLLISAFLVSAMFLFAMDVRKRCVIRSTFERINTPFWLLPFCREDYPSLLNRSAVVVTLKLNASKDDFYNRYAEVIGKMNGPYEDRQYTYTVYFKKGTDYDRVVNRMKQDTDVDGVSPVFLKTIH